MFYSDVFSHFFKLNHILEREHDCMAALILIKGKLTQRSLALYPPRVMAITK